MTNGHQFPLNQEFSPSAEPWAFPAIFHSSSHSQKFLHACMCVAHSRTVEIERDMESPPKPRRQGNRLMIGIAKVLNRNGKACSGTVSSRSSPGRTTECPSKITKRDKQPLLHLENGKGYRPPLPCKESEGGPRVMPRQAPGNSRWEG